MNDAMIRSVLCNINYKERSDGRLEGRLTINGQRKSFYGKTKTEIKQKVKDYLVKVDNGYTEAKKIQLNDYIEYWLHTYKLNKIEPSSYTRLFRVYDCQIKNSLGKKMIGTITTKDIQALIDEYAYPSSDSKKALALSGLKRIIHLLQPCFRMAVIEGVISSNPCDNVILPVESCIKKETQHQTTLSDSEIEAFKCIALSKYKNKNEYISRDALVLLIILNLGLRVGEALALEWNDFDFTTNVVHISKTIQSNIMNLQSGQNVTYNRIKKSAKTISGVRIIKLNDTSLFYIHELQKYDERNHIDTIYFCSTKVGTRNTARNLQRSLDRIICKADIKTHVTLHTLRHTFGSVMIRRGVGVEVVSKLMGHANINITYSKYIHVIQEQQACAMDLVSIS